MGFRTASRPASSPECSARARLTCWPIARAPPPSAGGPFKFTVTSPYMLARTLLDHHYGSFEARRWPSARSLREQCPAFPAPASRSMRPTSPATPPTLRSSGGHDEPRARPHRLASAPCTSASATTAARPSSLRVNWADAPRFPQRASLSTTSCSRLLTVRRSDLDALKDIDPRITLGIGVMDMKVNHIETPDEIASAHRGGREKVRRRAASAGCTPTAASGCSSVRSSIARLRR